VSADIESRRPRIRVAFNLSALCASILLEPLVRHAIAICGEQYGSGELLGLVALGVDCYARHRLARWTHWPARVLLWSVLVAVIVDLPRMFGLVTWLTGVAW
jgi:hypothetical protein